MGEMDAQVATDLAALEVLSVESLVRTTMLAFVSVYHRRRAFVEIYLRGRTNPAVHNFGREHNGRVAENLRAFAIDAGLAGDGLTAKIAQPCRCLPTIRPNTLVSAAPIEKISAIWTKLVSAFGFS